MKWLKCLWHSNAFYEWSCSNYSTWLSCLIFKDFQRKWCKCCWNKKDALNVDLMFWLRIEDIFRVKAIDWHGLFVRHTKRCNVKIWNWTVWDFCSLNAFYKLKLHNTRGCFHCLKKHFFAIKASIQTYLVNFDLHLFDQL